MGYQGCSQGGGSGSQAQDAVGVWAGFDAVIVAAPLELASLRFVRQAQPGDDDEEQAAQLLRSVPPRKFKTTHTTWVRGQLQTAQTKQTKSGLVGGGMSSRLPGPCRQLVSAVRSCAGVVWMAVAAVMCRVLGCRTKELPDSIYLTTTGSDEPTMFFSSIGRYREFDGKGGDGKGVGGGEGNGDGTGGRNVGGGVYKVFSTERLSDAQVLCVCVCVCVCVCACVCVRVFLSPCESPSL